MRKRRHRPHRPTAYGDFCFGFRRSMRIGLPIAIITLSILQSSRGQFSLTPYILWHLYFQHIW